MEQKPSRDDDPLARVRGGAWGAGSMGAAGKYVGLGFQMMFSILLFLWIGQWVDRWAGTKGLFMLLGVFVGAGASFYSMYKSLMADQAREEAAERARKAK